MRDFWKVLQDKLKNKNVIKILICLFILVIFLTSIFFVYHKNKKVQIWIDRYLLRKEVEQNKLTTIEIKDNSEVYAFNKYIAILAKNNLKIYNNVGSEETDEMIEINNPLFDSEGRFLAIAEENGTRLYVVEDKDIVWDREIEGKISQVRINKNGYVAVIITDTSYKTVIAIYDNQGTELFKQYLSTTRVLDVAISNDNKYLAISEIDTSGTIIQSSIKITSIEKAKNDPQNSIEKTIKGENNDLIVDIEYQDKNKLICKYTNKITVIEQNSDKEEILENIDKKIVFSEIELQNNIVTVEEKSSGLFTADSVLTITDIDSNHKSNYTTSSVTKELYTKDNIIALNLGTEVEFINTSGWLLKKYVAEQEITKISISNSIAGIIYRDKIELVIL